jgi:hypothetical protein
VSAAPGDRLLVEVKAKAKGLRGGEFVRLRAFTSDDEAREALAYPDSP